MSDATRTTLDPVCLALLADPRPRRAIDVLRVALATLAAANHILIDTAPGGERFVRVQRAPGPAASAHIVTVYRALRDAARSGQLSRAATQAALAQAFGTRFTRYADAEVAPALEARGLLRIETRRRLWVFSSRQMQRTASGDALAARLTQRVAELDTLPQLVDSDPVRALRLARAAGPMLLLSPHARSSIPRLQALAVTPLPGHAHALIEEPEPEWLELFEHAETLLSIDFDILLDAIEAIASFGDDASSSTSTDSDAGGGDGGGGGD